MGAPEPLREGVDLLAQNMSNVKYSGMAVCGVIDPIVQRHGLEMEGVDPLQTTNVVAVLVRKASALVGFYPISANG